MYFSLIIALKSYNCTLVLQFHKNICIHLIISQAKIALLESEIVKQKIDFESKYDKGLLVARENEKDKLNHIIEDLRQRFV